MSSVKIEGNASGTGIFTIASPNSNTNRTLTLPDVTGTFNTSGGVNEVPAGSASAPSIFFTSDSNTGMWSPAADTVAWTTGGTERARITSGGDFQFNSGYGSVATAYGCRMWVYFTVSAGTPSIGEDGNVTSITDNGVGDFTFNFTTSLPDTNYCVVAMGTGGGANYQIFGGNQTTYTKNTGSLRGTFAYVTSLVGGLTNQDPTSANVAIFR